MNQHLQLGARAARAGAMIGLFYLGSTLVGTLIFGQRPAWTATFITAALWAVAFGAGGVIYSLLLPRFARGRVPASAGARAGAGMAAGAAIMGLLVSPFLIRGGTLGVSGAAVVLLALAMGALIGASAGLLAIPPRVPRDRAPVS